jgi:Rieske 2Fe-2S family protein
MGLPEQRQDAAFEGTIVVRMVLSVNHLEAVSTGDSDSDQCASAHLNGLSGRHTGTKNTVGPSMPEKLNGNSGSLFEFCDDVEDAQGIGDQQMGAKTLRGEFFASPEVYARETQQIFRKNWICVGRASDLSAAGDFLVHEMNGESFIVVRDTHGRVSCFYNVCRHRGTRMQVEACGHFKTRIQCPYHAWTYDFQGSLKNAPNMNEVEGFDVKDYPLQTVHSVVWQGFVFINLDRDCPPFESFLASILTRFDDWRLSDLVSAHHVTYEVQANWKIVFQNYSECYHCSLVHPQLNPVTSVKTSSNDFTEGPFLGGPMVLSDAYDTVSVDGQLCGDWLPGLCDEDRNRVYFYTFFPTLFISPHPDYVLTHRIERSSCNSTRIVCDWLFPQEVVDQPGFDPTKAVEFWDVTNRQDWRVCELTQHGVQSEAYEPGPYSNLESMLVAFDRHYLKAMAEEECDT